MCVYDGKTDTPSGRKSLVVFDPMRFILLVLILKAKAEFISLLVPFYSPTGRRESDNINIEIPC